MPAIVVLLGMGWIRGRCPGAASALHLPAVMTALAMAVAGVHSRSPSRQWCGEGRGLSGLQQQLAWPPSLSHHSSAELVLVRCWLRLADSGRRSRTQSSLAVHFLAFACYVSFTVERWLSPLFTFGLLGALLTTFVNHAVRWSFATARVVK